MSKSSKGKKRARTVESSRAGSGTEGEVIGEDANEDEDDADDECEGSSALSHCWTSAALAAWMKNEFDDV